MQTAIPLYNSDISSHVIRISVQSRLNLPFPGSHMKFSHLKSLSGLTTTSMQVAMIANGTPRDQAIDVTAFKSDIALNALFTDLGAALNKPAADIQQHTIDALSTPGVNTLINKLKVGYSTKSDAEAQDVLDMVFMAAVDARLKKAGEKGQSRTGDGKGRGVRTERRRARGARRRIVWWTV
ncbi:hypothetical protein DPSP01_010986 [Paraphaeosphaeria sporulosa]